MAADRSDTDAVKAMKAALAAAKKAEATRFDQAARAQALSDLDELKAKPLIYGDHIAWAVQRFGRTDELSPLHRVGSKIEDHEYTTCRELIPDALLWIPLGPGLIRTLPRCKFCEAEHLRLSTRTTRRGKAA